MQFFEYGRLDGIPVLFLLGTPHTGKSAAELDGLASKLGIRLICTTRSWYVDTDINPSFENCTSNLISHLHENGIGYAYVIGVSGVGPFALHLATNHPRMIRACYLLASMGHPEVFKRTVASPHTRTLIELYASGDYERSLAQLSQWGIPTALAHGVWSDFKVLFDSRETVNFSCPVPVYIHHGEDDENAPLESVQALASHLTNCHLRISPSASHLALATDKEYAEFRSIFSEVMERDAAYI